MFAQKCENYENNKKKLLQNKETVTVLLKLYK